MIEAYIWVIIYLFVLSKWQAPLVDQIKETNDLQKQIYLRKQLKKLRRKSLLLFVSLFLITLFIIIYISDTPIDQAVKNFLIGPSFLYIVLRGVEGVNPLREISILTRKDIPNSNFVLFLRSFSKDNYSPEQRLKKFPKNCTNFSEYQYCKQIHKYLPIYAVGMTKEIEIPTGAKRFYLEDKRWKEDVQYLMHKASLIIILVDDRESCIWEIEEGNNYQEKMVYIVDNMETYNRVIRKSNNIPFPVIPYYPLPVSIHISQGGRADIYTFQHTKKSYKQLVQYHINTYLTGLSMVPYYRKKWLRIIICLVEFICTLGISSMISNIIGDGYNNVYYFFGTFLFLIIIFIIIDIRFFNK